MLIVENVRVFRVPFSRDYAMIFLNNNDGSISLQNGLNVYSIFVLEQLKNLYEFNFVLTLSFVLYERSIKKYIKNFQSGRIKDSIV